MSAETYETLNTKVLIGQTAPDAPHSRVPGVEYQAWHNMPSLYENGESNHYPYSIPLADIDRRLLDWQICEAPLRVPVTTMDESGVSSFELEDDRKVLYRSDTRKVLSVVGPDFNTPDYKRDVIDFASDMLSGAGGTLEIMSAGLIRGGGMFWTQFVLPEPMVAAGFAFSPYCTVTDSCDGRPWNMFRGSTAIVCDNTHALGMSTAVNMAKVRHTIRRRDLMILAAETVGIISTFGKEFAKRLDVLAGTTVTDAMWEKFLTQHFGEPGESKASKTVNQNNRDALTLTYATDPMCSPWFGTALGVVQAVNTTARHVAPTRGVRVDTETRHFNKLFSGKYFETDAKVIDELNKVLRSSGKKQLAFA